MALETPITDRPLRRDAERNRQRILAAAAEVFAEKGLGATLDDIARHAGVGVGTVYRRFPDKDALIDALFLERMGELRALVTDALAIEDPWVGLCEFMRRALALQASDRGLRELLGPNSRAVQRCGNAKAELKPLVQGLVTRAQEAGALRPDVAATDLSLILLMLGGLADCSDAVDIPVWDRLLGIALDGLATRRDAPTALPVPALGDAEFTAAMQGPPPR